MSSLTHALARKHLPNCQDQNAKIKPKTPVVHVPHIKRELSVPADIITTVDLSPAGDTRFHVMPPSLLGCVILQILRQKWPRTNQAHLAGQHIPQLRQLVETKSAEQFAETSQTNTIRRSFHLRTVPHHGAKLDDCKRSRFVAGTNLPEKNRPSHRDANCDGNDHQQWRYHYQPCGSDRNIQRTFAESVHRSFTDIAESKSFFTGAGNPR